MHNSRALEVAVEVCNPEIVRILLENGIGTERNNHASYFPAAIAMEEVLNEKKVVQIIRMLLDYPDLVPENQVRLNLIFSQSLIHILTGAKCVDARNCLRLSTYCR